MTKIQPKDFGKDHWGLFAYIETRCVDYKGVLDVDHLRIKNPAIVNRAPYPSPEGKQDWGTRLSGYFRDNEENDNTRQLPDHDDLDCIEDLETAGYIENIGTGLNPASKMTKLGIKVASLLRQHKADGNHFATFKI